MVIKEFYIENFKSIKSLVIDLNPQLSMLTGVNNCGKTTILEAIALWAECFNLLARRAEKSVAGRYHKGDCILGTQNNTYVDFSTLNSVPVPELNDIFYLRDSKAVINLTAIVAKADVGEQEIGFTLSTSSHSRYAIRLKDANTFDYQKFNRLFRTTPPAVSTYFSSPIANISVLEPFMTVPLVNRCLSTRESYKVMRNRIYTLYHGSATIFQRFEQQLSYILYGTSLVAKLQMNPKTDVNKDPNVVIVYTNDKNDIVKKDLSLLGSGSLQAIEILLNVYHGLDDKSDMYLILLDEPDSHIHRDVQKRLFEVLHQMGNTNQIVLTTHNESLIRSTPLENIFHINASARKVACLTSQDLSKLHIPHFKGLYPSAINPIIKSINSTAVGLDFVSAIESDMIVFVEGDDDARLLNCLFYQNPSNISKKIMFWVLGGVARVYDSLKIYKEFFSQIKNSKTLWEKSCLVFDQDILMDEHRKMIIQGMDKKYDLSAYCLDVYTQEAVLLTNSSLLADLLIARYELESPIRETLINELEAAMCSQLRIVRNRYKVDDKMVQCYKGRYINKMNEHFKAGINICDINLCRELENYYSSLPLHKLATKDDVAIVINTALQSVGCAEEYEPEECYSLVQKTDITSNFQMWKDMVAFLSERVK